MPPLYGVRHNDYICCMDFSTQFPVLKNYTYLNTAGSGILSQSIQQWRKEHDEEYIQRGSRFRLQQAEFLEDVRQQVARFFQGKATNTFLVQNLSFGFNTFLDGLAQDHKFLLINGDYPSVNYPVVSRGFRCAYAAADENLEQNILEEIKLFQPTILALSLVQYTTGVRINLDFLKRLKEAYPDLLIVADGTQFCGTCAFNFEASGCDVLIGSGYKWMLGGYGNGFVLIKDAVFHQLYGDRLSHSLPEESFLKHKKLLSLCFEPGHLDTLNFGTLKQSILFLETLGFDFIEKRIRTISKMAKDAFADRVLLSDEQALRDEPTAIFKLQADEVLLQKMKAANILFTHRGDGLRVSFHFYNNEQDLEQLLRAIDGN